MISRARISFSITVVCWFVCVGVLIGTDPQTVGQTVKVLLVVCIAGAILGVPVSTVLWLKEKKRQNLLHDVT